MFGLCAGSGASLSVGILFRLFIGDILLSKQLRTLSLAPRYNPTLFRKKRFNWFYTFIYTL